MGRGKWRVCSASIIFGALVINLAILEYTVCFYRIFYTIGYKAMLLWILIFSMPNLKTFSGVQLIIITNCVNTKFCY